MNKPKASKKPKQVRLGPYFLVGVVVGAELVKASSSSKRRLDLWSLNVGRKANLRPAHS